MDGKGLLLLFRGLFPVVHSSSACNCGAIQDEAADGLGVAVWSRDSVAGQLGTEAKSGVCLLRFDLCY